MTNSKNNKKKTADKKSARNNMKETSVDIVEDTKDDTKKDSIDTVNNAKHDNKDTSIDNVKDDEDDKKEVAKEEDTDAPIRPRPNNGGYSEHFDPIPAENNSKKNETGQLTTVDISK